MSSLDRYKQRLTSLGRTGLRDEQISGHKMMAEHRFNADPSYQEDANISYWDSGTIIYPRLYNQKYSTANGNLLEFQSVLSEPIVVGDILVDSKRQKAWLCIESTIIGDVLYEGRLNECNYTLKFQDRNGLILEYPALSLNSTQYNSGETIGKTMTLGSAQHIIMTTSDDNIVALSAPIRIYLGKNMIPFKITQNDTSTLNYDKGLARITVTQDLERHVSDRPDLGICDYWEPSPINQSPILLGHSVITHKTSPEVKLGSFKQLDFIAYNEEQEVVVITPKWNISTDNPLLDETLKIEQYGSSIRIYVDGSDSLIGETVIVSATSEDDEFQSNIIKLKVVSMI